jgi:hypothetical protein
VPDKDRNHNLAHHGSDDGKFGQRQRRTTMREGPDETRGQRNPREESGQRPKTPQLPVQDSVPPRPGSQPKKAER